MIQPMLAPMFRTMRAFFLANARASAGGSTLELPGVGAAIVPAMPERSVVNCVVAGELDLLDDPTPADFDPIVEAAYGWPGFASAIPAFPPSFRDFGRVQMWERRKPAPSG